MRRMVMAGGVVVVGSSRSSIALALARCFGHDVNTAERVTVSMEMWSRFDDKG